MVRKASHNLRTALSLACNGLVRLLVLQRSGAYSGDLDRGRGLLERACSRRKKCPAAELSRSPTTSALPPWATSCSVHECGNFQRLETSAPRMSCIAGSLLPTKKDLRRSQSGIHHRCVDGLVRNN